LADLRFKLATMMVAAIIIEYGIANSKEDLKYASMKGNSLTKLYLKQPLSILKSVGRFNKDQAIIDGALAYDEALKIDPILRLASLQQTGFTVQKDKSQENKDRNQ